MFSYITKGLAIMQFMLGLIPYITAIVKSFEVPGYGEDKLVAVLATIRAAWDLLPVEVKSLLHLDAVEKYVTGVIKVIVRLYNTTGVFQTSTSTSVAVVTEKV